MDQERLRQIEEIFHQALDHAPDIRNEWLTRVCADDPDLRFQVEQLLSRADEDSALLENRIGAAAEDVVAGKALESGTKFGPYQILDVAGFGGMGVVYRARDTRLDRTVAIKVLTPVPFDSASRERFMREARAVSRLNHPHICMLHDIGNADGTDYLVMEYLEGETLQHRLKRGYLALDDALQYAIQIAQALKKAHSEGVIHRDLSGSHIQTHSERFLDGNAPLHVAGSIAG
ncbi:MAG: serine/threonine protein kinase [Acidobacteria bacterium]|nr:serine/threonine protein kinase [Acidobacteriota bacterium]